MFSNVPTNPSRLKRVIYLFSATALGILLSFIAHAVIEISYLRWAESENLTVPFYNGCALLPVLQIALFVSGAICGLILGDIGWRKVYIERIRAKK